MKVEGKWVSYFFLFFIFLQFFFRVTFYKILTVRAMKFPYPIRELHRFRLYHYYYYYYFIPC